VLSLSGEGRSMRYVNIIPRSCAQSARLMLGPTSMGVWSTNRNVLFVSLVRCAQRIAMQNVKVGILSLRRQIGPMIQTGLTGRQVPPGRLDKPGREAVPRTTVLSELRLRPRLT
jgi:hypothetical protein